MKANAPARLLAIREAAASVALDGETQTTEETTMSEKPLPWHGISKLGMDWIAIAPIPERKRVALCIVSANQITWEPVAYFTDEEKAKRFLGLLDHYVFGRSYEEQVRKLPDEVDRLRARNTQLAKALESADD